MKNHSKHAVCQSTGEPLTSIFGAVCMLVAQSCMTLCTPRTAALQTPLSMEISRQEYWNGLSFPSPGDLPNPGIEPRSAR